MFLVSATRRRSVDAGVRPILRRNLGWEPKLGVFSESRKMRQAPCLFRKRADLAVFGIAKQLPNWTDTSTFAN